MLLSGVGFSIDFSAYFCIKISGSANTQIMLKLPVPLPVAAFISADNQGIVVVVYVEQH